MCPTGEIVGRTESIFVKSTSKIRQILSQGLKTINAHFCLYVVVRALLYLNIYSGVGFCFFYIHLRGAFGDALDVWV